ncbi:MAG: general secretion pathway protein GspK [Hyphomicrobiaceae bacterium]|nr:general secretion pathway protein GspK [Hyphomicrobiaceae bacterium]
MLVTVLWGIAFLSALAMAAAVSFRAFTGVMAVDRDRIHTIALLTAGLELAAGLIQSAPERPLVGVEGSIALASGTVAARLNDEGGRIDIGRAPPEVLTALLVHVGAPPLQAEELAQRMVARRRVEDSEPPDAGRTRAPQRRNEASDADPPFSDVRQLAQIPGMAPQWVAAMLPLATVYGSETVNPLTSPAAVIAALPGVSQPALETFLQMRRGLAADEPRLHQVLGPAQKYLAVRPQRVVAVDLVARLSNGATASAQAVIVLLPKDSQPYRVLSWTAPAQGSR